MSVNAKLSPLQVSQYVSKILDVLGESSNDPHKVHQVLSAVAATCSVSLGTESVASPRKRTGRSRSRGRERSPAAVPKEAPKSVLKPTIPKPQAKPSKNYVDFGTVTPREILKSAVKSEDIEGTKKTHETRLRSARQKALSALAELKLRELEARTESTPSLADLFGVWKSRAVYWNAYHTLQDRLETFDRFFDSSGKKDVFVELDQPPDWHTLTGERFKDSSNFQKEYEKWKKKNPGFLPWKDTEFCSLVNKLSGKGVIVQTENGHFALPQYDSWKLS